MAYELSDRAKLLAAKEQKNIQLLVKIEGYDKVFTTLPNEQFWKIGDPYFIGQVGLIIGGTIEDVNTMPLVTMEGTTNSITQQLSQDKGGASSIQGMTISIIDQGGVVSAELNELSPDILSRRCDVYLGFQQSIFPQDFITIFIGTITEFTAGAGNVQLKVANPERLKSQDIFLKVSGELTSPLTNVATSIAVDSTEGLLLPDGELTCYVRIDDEIIKYENTNTTNILVCTRGQLGTSAVAHDSGATFDSFYKLDGNPIDLALKVMLSTGARTRYYVADVVIQRSAIDKLYIDDPLFIDTYNIQIGDFLWTTGLDSDLMGAVVNGLETTDLQSVIQYQITTPAIDETPLAGFLSIVSQYNTLPDGCSIAPHEVDIDQFETIRQRIGSALPTASIYLKDTITAKEFIDSQLLFPIGGYSLPRKGRISMGFVQSPTAETSTRVINKDNVINASKIIISRSTEKQFYNAIVYRYDEDTLEDKFLKGRITLSATSQNRIRTGNKPMTIDAKIFRSGAETYIAAQSERFLDRYQFGAEGFKVEVSYGVGWAIEVGDTVIFDGTDLQMFDSKSSTRSFAPRVMEVINKSMSLKNGSVVLDLLDTSFSVTGRYVSVAPSSFITSGSTTTNLKLSNSQGLSLGELETDRWAPFIREKVKVCSPDYATQYVTTIRGVSGGLLDPVLTVDALPAIPSAGWAVLVNDYDSDARNKFKPLFGFLNPVVYVSSGTSNTVFTVLDSTNLFEGAIIRVEESDYSAQSPDVAITDITGNVVTVESSLGFTPDSTMIVTLIGFKDDLGLPYRYS